MPKNIITLGIGAAPGSVKYFVTVGLDIGVAEEGNIALTLQARNLDMTVDARSRALAANTRTTGFTLEDR